MRVGRPRIWLLGVVFAALGCGLGVHLYLLVIEQGSMWTERSYRNRWAFRDVPTHRGSILDRDGALLARDEPVFSLMVHYRAFRREHPIGAAVHGANLMMETAGHGGDVFDFRDGSRGARQALASLMTLPWTWLGGEVIESEVARDLRFYVVSLVSASMGVSWSTASRELRKLKPAEGATLAAALGPALVDRMYRELDTRAAELEGIVATVAVETGSSKLWDVLESRRALYATRPELEHVERTVDRRVSFEASARIAMLRERHPGLHTRPSVSRAHGVVPGRGDLASLRSVVGTLTPFWNEDEDLDQIADEVGRVLHDDALDRLVPRDPEHPASLAEGLTRRAHRNISAHLEVHGRVGRSGVEAAKQDLLAGRPGLRLVERDRKSRETGQWGALRTSPGRDLRITVDLDLQALLECALDAKQAGQECAAAVIDPRSGDILALAGRPLPASDEPMWTTPAAYWKHTGFLGSVAKPFVLLEHLDAIRRGRPHEHHSTFEECAGAFHTHGLVLGCSNHGARGTRGASSIAVSCNFFFFQAARGLGDDGIANAFRRVGLDGEDEPRFQRYVPGVRVARPASERAGHVLPRRAIGYGVVASTLHVARAYASLATGVLPRLGFFVEDRDHLAVPLGVAEQDLDEVRDGMRACVEWGTAEDIPRLYNLGVLGKTGTAEIAVSTGANNAWFAGYLTREAPTLAFAAVAYVVPDKEHGGDVAGAMVEEFLSAVHADEALRQRYMPGGSGR